jgi:hypothetical protein
MDSTILNGKKILDHKKHYIIQKPLICVIFKDNGTWRFGSMCGILLVDSLSNGPTTQLIMQNAIYYTYSV